MAPRITLALVSAVTLATAIAGTGCASGTAKPPPADSQTASSSATMVAWERCLVSISGDSSLRDLPPFPYRDPGPSGITVSGPAARRSGSINNDPVMTLADALQAAQVPANTPVVVWRCEDGKMRALRMRPDAQLNVHDWVVAPDPTAVY